MAMDEAGWCSATRPMPMLVCLRRLRRPASERGFRFFTYACCRLAWPTFADERSRNAIETAERFMVGLATQQELTKATQESQAACEEAYAVESARLPGEFSSTKHSLAMGTAIAVRALVHGYTQSVVVKVRDALAFHGLIRNPDDVGSLFAEMSHSLRDIFGNPFRPVPLDPAWLTSDVVALARGIYDEKAFDRMPILADALQDAGCDNADVLEHCRGDSTHVRGCWVVDLVLGKV